MKIIEINNVPKAPNPHGVDIRKFHETEKVMVAQITLMPGENIMKHSAPVDVLFFVLEGTGLFELGNESSEIHKDCCVESKAGHEHCWYNKSQEKLRIMVIKVA